MATPPESDTADPWYLPPEELAARAEDCRQYSNATVYRKKTRAKLHRRNCCPVCGDHTRVIINIGCVVCEARRARRIKGLPE